MNMDTEAEIEPNQRLPDDLVLMIVARCGTVGDAIRCAATSGESSTRPSSGTSAASSTMAGDMTSATTAAGSSRRSSSACTTKAAIRTSSRRLSHQLPSSDGAKLLLSLATLPSAPNRDGDGDSARDFGPYLPVASHRSLLVLQHRWKSTAKEHLIERHGPRPAPRRAVRVQPDRPRGSGACSRRTTCNARHVPRPPRRGPNRRPVVIVFKLLVAELSNNHPSTLYVQIFSSDSDSDEGGGGWGPALAYPIVSKLRESRFKFGCSHENTGRPRPAVVLGDTIYWLCTSGLGYRILMWRWRGGEAREACIVDPSPRYVQSRAPGGGSSVSWCCRLRPTLRVRGHRHSWA